MSYTVRLYLNSWPHYYHAIEATAAMEKSCMVSRIMGMVQISKVVEGKSLLPEGNNPNY